MKYKKVLPGILMLLTIPSSVACVRVDTGSILPTFGEQILDLVEVYEIGLISAAEFQILRRALIRALGR